jgi:hypothetical protein
MRELTPVRAYLHLHLQEAYLCPWSKHQWQHNLLESNISGDIVVGGRTLQISP